MQASVGSGNAPFDLFGFAYTRILIESKGQNARRERAAMEAGEILLHE